MFVPMFKLRILICLDKKCSLILGAEMEGAPQNRLILYLKNIKAH